MTIVLVTVKQAATNQSMSPQRDTKLPSSMSRVCSSAISFTYFLKRPSTPVTPIPSTISRVNRKGTVSGVGRHRPCSNATPSKRKIQFFLIQFLTIIIKLKVEAMVLMIQKSLKR